jgi:hypothetical protein
MSIIEELEDILFRCSFIDPNFAKYMLACKLRNERITDMTPEELSDRYQDFRNDPAIITIKNSLIGIPITANEARWHGNFAYFRLHFSEYFHVTK